MYPGGTWQIASSSLDLLTIILSFAKMYPGLASGPHDAIRWISKPFSSAKEEAKAVEFVVISEMRWRVWRVDVAGSTTQRRFVWPTVHQSLALPSYSVQSWLSILVHHNFAHSLYVFL